MNICNATANDKRTALCLAPLHLLILSAVVVCQASAFADPQAVEFESGFLTPGTGQSVDIARFEKGNPILPGQYSVDLYLNADWVGRVEVPFKDDPAVQGKHNARACFDKSLLERMGIDRAKLAPEVTTALENLGTCLPIGDVVEGATSTFELADQRLDLSIAQVALKRSARGYVSPDLWDDGVNAGFLGYDFNQYRTSAKGQQSSTYSFMGLNTGVNIGDWQLRHNGSYSHSTQGPSSYQSVATYVQRGLPSLAAQLIMGESYTTGELFDSTQFRGVRVSTDDRMLPDSLRGYAPTVRGVASSNAKVTIKQNGMTIYESTVAAGAFEIDDLYATGYGGDLIVSVMEADGREHSFTVPYAAVPMSLRPGSNRYSLAAGTVRDTQLSNSPLFTQATWQHGFTNLFTGYAGTNVAQGYTAGMIGGAFNTEFGALGMDLTQATTDVYEQGKVSGQSMRVSYSKSVLETGTQVAIAAYRYSTGGYLDLNTAMRVRDEQQVNGLETVLRQRDRAQFTLSQQLGDSGGQLSLNSSTVNYWNRSGADMNYSLGYNNSHGRVSYSIQATRERNAKGTMDTQYYASITVPLGQTNPVTISSSMMRDSQGRSQAQAMLNRTAGVDNNIGYGVTASRSSDAGATTNSGGANVQYRSPYAEFWASVGGGTGYNQSSIGVRGAVVAHPGGMTLSTPLSDTFAIVEAKDAEGVRVLNASGTRVDSRGYAVVPYMTAYSMNNIELDPKGLSTDVELQVASQQVAPKAGSVAFIKFATVFGRAAVIRVSQANGMALPFGAVVLDETGKEIGVVGQAGKVFARGLQTKGTLTVKWSGETVSECQVAYELPERDKGDKADSFQQIKAICSEPSQHSTE